MIRYAVLAALVVGVIFAIVLYLGHREDEAERRGIERQVARDVAKANQEIATRRETDEKFDSQDARALCLSMSLDWVLEDGKSFCR